MHIQRQFHSLYMCELDYKAISDHGRPQDFFGMGKFIGVVRIFSMGCTFFS